MYEHQILFWTLLDGEEIFAEFDKKCIGLELQTTPSGIVL